MVSQDKDVILRIEMRRLPGGQASLNHLIMPANAQEARAIMNVLTDMQKQLIELTKQAAINAQKNAGKQFTGFN